MIVIYHSYCVWPEKREFEILVVYLFVSVLLQYTTLEGLLPNPFFFLLPSHDRTERFKQLHAVFRFFFFFFLDRPLVTISFNFTGKGN